jgi:hypothetical protein
MTFKEAMINELTSRGMFPSQAEEVIEKQIKESKDDCVKSLWNKDVSGYPDSMKNIMWMGVKKSAYEWIEVNAPEAWFRPMFH